MADHRLDCKGLNCPMPIVRISQEMKKLSQGETLSIEADHPAFLVDLEAWIRKTGNTLVESTDGPIQHAVVQKV